MNKKKYQVPTMETTCTHVTEDYLVTVTGTQGQLPDGTTIGDGGDDDDDVIPSVNAWKGFDEEL